jgi:hypothetical protein
MYVTVTYPANTRGENCVALGNAAPVNSSTPSNNISCVPFCVGGTEYCFGTQTAPPQRPPPPPPTITVDCPAGMRRGFNGQCFFVDPGCQGPNCGQVTTGCPGNAARRPDGACCNARDYQAGGACSGTQGCTGGKTFNDGACRCPYPSTENSAGNCVKSESQESRRPPRHKTPRKPRKPDSDNPAPSGSSPQFNIQIGPGFPGGRPSGGKPSGGTPKGGGCGKSCG